MTDNKAIVINKADNVGLAVKDLKAGDIVIVMAGKTEKSIMLKDDIKFLHKFALTDIKSGDKILKYGQVIGGATRDIAAGEHVHTHNIKSLRGQFSRNKARSERK
jgi:altronate dehydratase small subunit